MSAEATFWAWMMGVKPSACKLVLLCLADCHNSDTHRCDPSTRYITDFTGLDKKTVPEALIKLETMGLVTPKKRPGTSTHYELHIHSNPVPARKEGERKKPVPVAVIAKPGVTRKRGNPKTGTHPPQKRVTPKTGIPENGVTRKREEGIPENGEGGYPKTGNEPTKNLPGTYNLPESYDSAAGAALPVDNFSLPDLKAIYSNPDSESEILNHGVTLLERSGVEFGQARNFLLMLIKKHGPGRTLDGLIVCLIEQPVEPKSYLQAVVKKLGDEIPKDWVPPAPCLAQLTALGIPEDIYRDARDVFVIWFREQGIRHTNFPDLFVRWCTRDWERAEYNKGLYLQRLRAAASLEQPFHEPA